MQVAGDLRASLQETLQDVATDGAQDSLRLIHSNKLPKNPSLGCSGSLEPAKTYQDRKKIMRSLCKKARTPYFRFHPLRHSSVSVMDDQSAPTGAIQKILGHKNRSTTEIYLHTLGGAERTAIQALEQARKGKSLTQTLTRS